MFGFRSKKRDEQDKQPPHLPVDRSMMEQAIKAQVVPVLRNLGFKGSFPNFYRDASGFVSLINFQFFSSGGSFCINLSYAGPDRENLFEASKNREAKHIRVASTRDQVRLGSENLIGDHWFSFGLTSYQQYRGEPQPVPQLVEEMIELFRSQAELWWEEMRIQLKNPDTTESATP